MSEKEFASTGLFRQWRRRARAARSACVDRHGSGGEASRRCEERPRVRRGVERARGDAAFASVGIRTARSERVSVELCVFTCERRRFVRGGRRLNHECAKEARPRNSPEVVFPKRQSEGGGRSPTSSHYLGHLGDGDDSGDHVGERHAGRLVAETSAGKTLQ